MIAYIIAGKSGSIEVIPLSSKIKLFSVISFDKVSKLTTQHDVPAMYNSLKTNSPYYCQTI
jgi:hypothetical protein